MSVPLSAATMWRTEARDRASLDLHDAHRRERRVAALAVVVLVNNAPCYGRTPIMGNPLNRRRSTFVKTYHRWSRLCDELLRRR